MKLFLLVVIIAISGLAGYYLTEGAEKIVTPTARTIVLNQAPSKQLSGPNSKLADFFVEANAFRQELAGLAPSEIDTLRASDGACTVFPCGNLSEGEAAEILGNYVDDIEREKDLIMRAANLAVAIFGVLIAFISLRQSIQADRRSVSNEAKLNALEGAKE